MWLRNLVFIALCLAGFGALAANLLSSSRIRNPQSFAPERYEQPDLREIVTQVDEQFRQRWQTEGLPAARKADELAIVRRLSLGLTGTVPSLEELRHLERHSRGEQVEWWLSRLLEDRRYADYVAERLARAYVGTEEGPFVFYRRRRFVAWLGDRLQENAAYDQVVRMLLSDTGLWTSNPAVNFLTVTLDDNKEEQPDEKSLAGRTTRAFLGMRIDCLQCHDDRLGNVRLGTQDNPRSGQQSDFHQLASFFGDAEAAVSGIRDNDDNEYKYRYLKADAEEVVPALVPFLPELLPAHGTLRERLAGWVTHKQNRPFARATVNRIWALMFGRPLAEPIDDLPLDGPFPPGLEILASDFAEHDFDLRRLIRIIAATQVFQADSQADFEVQPRHEENWVVFPLSRLRPEQVAGSLIQAASLSTIDANSHILFQIARSLGENEFVQRYGDKGEDEFDDRGGTITQRLLMMNGELVKTKTKADLFTASSRIADLSPDDAKAIEITYLASLTRRPTPEELTHFLERLAGSQGSDRAERIEDLYWVLVNSTEFSWSH